MRDSVADTTPPSATLREAAALMRQRAKESVPSPWRTDIIPGTGRAWVEVPGVDGHAWGMHGFPAESEHVASWHPSVALAVADLLDYHADHFTDTRPARTENALRVARTYLGRAS